MTPAALLRAAATAASRGTVLAFALDHARGGVDPLPAAWAACDDDNALMALLLAAGRRWAVGTTICAGCLAANDVDDLVAPTRTWPAHCAACAARIRRHHAAPTLAELAAARGNRRAA